MFKGIESGFHKLTKLVDRTEDCDYGHCVGVNVKNGDDNVTVWLYTHTKEEAIALEAAMVTSVHMIQVINFGPPVSQRVDHAL